MTSDTSVPRTLLDQDSPWLVGVIHLSALPGAPGSRLDVTTIAAHAVEDAGILHAAGFTAVLLENFHDTPFHAEQVPPETIAAMAVVTHAVRRSMPLPVGINVLRNDAMAALAIAAAAGGSFLRVNVLAGTAATDQGLVTGPAADLLRRRSVLGPHVAVLADVDVKHATALDRRPLVERARDLARRGGADVVLVTGPSTGRAVDLEELASVAEAVAPTPVLAASGTTVETLPDVLARCMGVIVGTALQDPERGRIDAARTRSYAEAARR